MKNMWILNLFVFISLNFNSNIDAMKKRKKGVIDLSHDEDNSAQKKTRVFFKPVTIDLTNDEDNNMPNNEHNNMPNFLQMNNNNNQNDQQETLQFLRNTIASDTTIKTIKEILNSIDQDRNEIDEISTIRNLINDDDTTLEDLRLMLNIEPINKNNNDMEIPKEECSICTDDEEELITLECGHKRACKSCLIESLTPGIREKNSASWKCTMNGCNHIMTEGDIKKIAPNLYDQCVNIMSENFITKINNIKQCPTPNCPYQFENDNNLQQPIRCPGCEVTYCSSCLVNHNPEVSCEDFRNHHERERDNQEILAQNPNIKKCPNPNRNCLAIIEKNGGCKHMQCTQCNYHWCWDCEQEFRMGINGNHTDFYACPNQPVNRNRPINRPVINNNNQPLHNNPQAQPYQWRNNPLVRNVISGVRNGIQQINNGIRWFMQGN